MSRLLIHTTPCALRPLRIAAVARAALKGAAVMNPAALFAATFGLLFGASSRAQAQTTYSITAIPLLKGASAAIGRAVNNNGEVVGSSTGAPGWYWRSTVNGGNPVAIPVPSGTSGTGPLAINSNGYVVGQAPPYFFVWKYGANGGQATLLNQASANGPNGSWGVVINDANQVVSTRDVVASGVSVPHGCAWERNSSGQWQAADLPPLAGDNASWGYALNNNGLVVGVSFVISFDAQGNAIYGPQHLLSWQKDPLTGDWQGTAIPDAVTGATMYHVTNVNTSGQAVGWAIDHASGATQGFFVDTNTLAVTPLGTLGGSQGRTHGLNDAGQVTGWSTLADGTNRAVYWDPSRGADNWRNLGTLGGPSSRAAGSASDTGDCHINSSGYVVGYSYNSKGVVHGFVWDAARGMRDLNAITPNKAGFSELDSAWAISDSGQITGMGVTKGKQAAYLLTPQP